MDTETQPELKTKKPLYKRPLGIILIVVGVILFILLLVFSALVFRYYRAIMAGGALPNLSSQQSFTMSETLVETAVGGSGVALADMVTDDDPSLGPPDAPLTIVEFVDFECPYCLQAFPIVRELTAKYPDKIYYIVRDLPLEELHPGATLASEAGACAHAQNRFWAYHDKLFQNQGALSRDDLVVYARQVGLDEQKFTACIDSGEFKSEVQEDLQAGIQAGAVGTPTFFVNGYKFQGVIPQEVWDQLMQLVDIRG